MCKYSVKLLPYFQGAPVYPTNDDKPPWLSIVPAVLYIQIYLTSRPEGKKSLSGIFSRCAVAASLPLGLVDAHRLLSVREGGDGSQLLGPLRTSLLAAHASVIMALSHIAG